MVGEAEKKKLSKLSWGLAELDKSNSNINLGWKLTLPRNFPHGDWVWWVLVEYKANMACPAELEHGASLAWARLINK